VGVIKSSVLKPKPKNLLLIYRGIDVKKLKNLPQLWQHFFRIFYFLKLFL
jgi:hypothetical protein